jgi:hypothetical protein
MRDNKELESIGKNAYASILEMVQALQKAESGDDESAREQAREAIEQDALSVRVRGGWYNVGEAPDPAPEEFEILLSTGGPATRIVGELSEHGEPTRVTLQAQDWGTPWTDYRDADDQILQAYASVFYFSAE